MNPIQFADKFVTPEKEKRMYRKIAVSFAPDEKTLDALTRTVKDGFVSAFCRLIIRE